MSFVTSAVTPISPNQDTPIRQLNLDSEIGSSITVAENSEESKPTISSRQRTDIDAKSSSSTVESDVILENHTAPICNSFDRTVTIATQKSVDDQLVLLKINALSGSATAQFELGEHFDNPNDFVQEEPEAMRWYCMAADQGHSRAQYCLGLKFSQGRQIKQNYVQAVYWFRKAADQNDPSAQCYLGRMYASGRGVDHDEDEALIWYRKAADQMYGPAEFELGLAYANGRGIAQDDAESARLYLKAALQGIAKAQSALAVRYANGRGVELDESKAAYWYKKAADQGHTMARNHLQKCYREGKGVDVDLKLATYWSLKAGFKDGGDSIQMVDELESTKFITSVLQEYPEFCNVKKLIFVNPFLFTKQMAFFEQFMRSNLMLTSVDFLRVDFENSASLLDRYLKSTTTVTELLFDEEFLDKKIIDSIKISLIKNSAISQLRKFFIFQLLKPTALYPLDLVSILIDCLIVISLKLGCSIEHTKKAIDEFLLITSFRQ